MQPADRAANRQRGRLIDVVGVDLPHRGGSHPDSDRRRTDASGQEIAIPLAQDLGVIHPSNRSLANLVRKSREDYDALRRCGVGGVGALAWKNLSKLGQFL